MPTAVVEVSASRIDPKKGSGIVDSLDTVFDPFAATSLGQDGKLSSVVGAISSFEG